MWDNPRIKSFNLVAEICNDRLGGQLKQKNIFHRFW